MRHRNPFDCTCGPCLAWQSTTSLHQQTPTQRTRVCEHAKEYRRFWRIEDHPEIEETLKEAGLD